MPPKKSKSPSFLELEALNTLVEKRHVWIVAGQLVTGKVSGTDAAIGDAACQSRTPLLLDAAEQVRKHLTRTGKHAKALELISAFERAHANDKKDSQVKTVDDALGGQHPLEFDTLIQELDQILGDDILATAGLCHTHTVPVTFSYDEFKILFSARNNNMWRVSTPEAVAQNKPQLLEDHNFSLRRDLAVGATSYMTRVARSLASPEFRDTPPNATLKPWPTLADQAAAALENMTSAIVGPGGVEIPLQSGFNQTLVSLMNDFAHNRGINVWVRRIEMTPIFDEGAQDDGETLERSDPTNFTRKLTSARALHFAPDMATGLFKFKPLDTSGQEATEPGTAYACWSSYIKDAEGEGLASSDDEEFYSALKSDADVTWLLLTDLACHPPFTGHAKNRSPKFGPVYDQICTPAAEKFPYSRERCAGLSFKKGAANCPPLDHIWNHARLIGLESHLTKASAYIGGGENNTCFLRNPKPVDFKIEHIHVLSFIEMTQLNDALLARHRAAPNAVIGDFVFRSSECGFSCATKEEADKFSRVKNENTKRADYKIAYPDNSALVTN